MMGLTIGRNRYSKSQSNQVDMERGKNVNRKFMPVRLRYVGDMIHSTAETNHKGGAGEG